MTLAKAVEARQIDGLFFPEHTHIPVMDQPQFRGGGELPEQYWRMHDPFVGLSAAVGATDNLQIGTSICLVPERDPIILAKACASLDQLSGGRFLFGIGAGWNEDEMANHGTAFKDRWKVLRERVLAMKRIWSEDEPEFHGDFVDFDPIWSYPKPARTGGPPVLLGTASRRGLDRIAEYCDGWLPILRPASDSIDNIKENLKALEQAMDKRERPMNELRLAVMAQEVKDNNKLGELIELGFTDISFALPHAGIDEVLRTLDDIAGTVDKLRSG